MYQKVLKFLFVFSLFFVSTFNVNAEEGEMCSSTSTVDDGSSCVTTYTYGPYAKVKTNPGGFYELVFDYKITVTCSYETGYKAVFNQYETGNAEPGYNDASSISGSAGTNPTPTVKTLYLKDSADKFSEIITLEASKLVLNESASGQQDDVPKVGQTSNPSLAQCLDGDVNACASAFETLSHKGKIESTKEVKDFEENEQEGTAKDNPDYVTKVITYKDGREAFYYQPAWLADYNEINGTNYGIGLEVVGRVQSEPPKTATIKNGTVSDIISDTCDLKGPKERQCPSCSYSSGQSYSNGVITSVSSVKDPSAGEYSKVNSTKQVWDCIDNEEENPSDDNNSQSTENNNQSAENNNENKDEDPNAGKICGWKTESCYTEYDKKRCSCVIHYSVMGNIYGYKTQSIVTTVYEGEYSIPLNMPDYINGSFDEVKGKFIPLSTLTGEYNYTITDENGVEVGNCDLLVTGNNNPIPPEPDIPWNKLIGFRMVTLNNMFPGRNPKRNWQGYDLDIKILKSSNSPMYVINLTSGLMRKIAKSNTLEKYVNWGSELGETYHPMSITNGVKTYEYMYDYKNSWLDGLGNGVVVRYEDNIKKRNQFLVKNGYNEYYTNLNYLKEGEAE